MRRLSLVVAVAFWLSVATLATILGGCAGVPCVCICDDRQPRQRVESPARVRNLEAEVERMRAQIRAWNEEEALDDAAEAAGKVVGHAAR